MRRRPKMWVARRERVAVLRDLSILDTPPESAYDDLASLAASVCRSDVTDSPGLIATALGMKSRYNYPQKKCCRPLRIDTRGEDRPGTAMCGWPLRAALLSPSVKPRNAGCTEGR